MPGSVAPPALGLSLPTSFASGSVDLGTLTRLAIGAEERGFSAVSCGDHLLWHSVLLDPLLVLASLTGVTQRIALMTSVLLAPLRHPLWIAKQTATLQHLSGGRLVLGMGIGGELPGEFTALGLDPRQRGARLDAALDVLERAWAEQDHALHVDIDGQRAELAPAGHCPPVWLGGRSPAAVDRAARRADGLLSIFMRPTALTELATRLRRAAEGHGRDPATVQAGTQLFVCYDDDADRADSRAAAFMEGHFGSADARVMGHVIRGDRASLRSALAPHLDSGADFVQTHIVGDRAEQTADAIADAVADWLPAPAMPGTAPARGRDRDVDA